MQNVKIQKGHDGVPLLLARGCDVTLVATRTAGYIACRDGAQHVAPLWKRRRLVEAGGYGFHDRAVGIVVFEGPDVGAAEAAQIDVAHF